MTTPELTVEKCLEELREMFVGQRVSIVEKRRLLAFPDVRKRVDEETDYAITIGKSFSAKMFTAPTLSEAMAQVRKWNQEQGK